MIENLKDIDLPNLNKLVCMDDYQNNNNILSSLNSPNNFFSSFDNSDSIKEFSEIINQNNDIPKYFNQEYDITEEENIDDINEILNRNIGFL